MYLLNRFFTSPLEALFTFLIFIISKEEGVTPLILTTIACLKPITALASYYLASYSVNLRRYLLTITTLTCLPCFFFPFVSNLWFYVAAYALFMIGHRAVFPAWMEILKQTVPDQKLPSLISKGISLTYFMSICLPPALSYWMDQDPLFWKWAYAALAGLQLCSLIIIYSLKPFKRETPPTLNPWKSSFKILRKSRHFTSYLLLYCLGGVAILFVQPILPLYFKESLNLSFVELSLAFSFCKGIMYLFTSPYWAKLSNRFTLFHINAFANSLTAAFFIFIIASQYNTAYIYAAYLFYGSMQAGAEMSKSLSGPRFSGTDDSVDYSNLNLALIGTRGLVAPYIGHVLFVTTSATTTLGIALAVSVASILFALYLIQKEQKYSYSVN